MTKYKPQFKSLSELRTEKERVKRILESADISLKNILPAINSKNNVIRPILTNWLINFTIRKIKNYFLKKF